MTAAPEIQRDTPSREELVQRAADLIPLLRKNAPQADRERRLPEENLDALEESGLLRMTRPRRYGGYEIDARTKYEVLSELARGCASTAWVTMIYTDVSFIIGKFPDEVQDEVFSDSHVRATGTLIPTAQAVRVAGGFRVGGQWRFNTGSLHAQWVFEPAIVEFEAGRPEVCIFLMRWSELEIIDDWYVSGLRATGSNSAVAREVFVPENRVLRFVDLKEDHSKSEANKGSHLYAIPAFPFVFTSGGSHLPGVAKAALDLFLERAQDRPITYTGYTKKSDAAVTHLQVAEVSLKIAAADHLMHEASEILDYRAATGTPWAPEDMPKVWGIVSYTSRLCAEAIETIRQAAGASAINDGDPMQLIARDAGALSTHAAMMPTTGLEHYGRSLCGLPPTTPLL
jgi:alkylation response protein AidB-like acyl-CoA dehydrogenase